MAEIQVGHITHLVDEEGNSVWLTDQIGNKLEHEKSPTIETIQEEDPVLSVQPVQAFMSTNLNNKIKCFEDLMYRILYFFGYPSVSVTDLHRDQIFEAISIACEFFTKYAGFSSEYLVFDSNIYEVNRGVRLDQLYTISSIEANHQKHSAPVIQRRGPDQLLTANKDVYVCRVPISKDDYYISEEDYKMLRDKCSKADKPLIEYLRDFSKEHPNGLEELEIISGVLYDYLVLRRGYKQENFKKSRDKIVTEGGEKVNIYWEDEDLGRQRDDLHYRKMYDYDLMDYRKVLTVNEYNEGSSTAMTSLFSFESALASQTYFTYQFSLRGFDMVSWYSMHEWRKTREKMLATKRTWNFDENTQYFTLSPQPQPNQRFFGVLNCYIEKPLRAIIKEQWVFQYALALCKIMVGRVRSKWGDNQSIVGTSGSLSGNALVSEGLQEKEKLEQLLQEKRGYGDAPPPKFLIG